MLLDHRDDATDLMRAEAAALRDFRRVEPYLDRRLAAIDVDVWRLVRLVTVEIEAKVPRS